MFKPRTQDEQFLLSTVCIETEHGTATGFFFGCQKGKSDLLITSRHVVDGASYGLLRLHNAFWKDNCHDESPTFEIELNNFENLWIKHPEESIDLVALPCKVIDDAAARIGREAHWMTIESVMVPSAARLVALSAVEDVLMLGYPNGLWDKSHNLPIYCRGITASHPEIDFCEKPEILIDIACLPGSTGSPVFVLNAKGHTDDRGNVRCGEPQNLLLGVVHGSATIGSGGQIAAPPTSMAIRSREDYAIHLTYVIKSQELLRFAEVIPQRCQVATT
ncbi:MAG TPA: hypothetical protein VGG64_15445 [Pirellulales bacterium]|jgi:hypothetical protein